MTAAALLELLESFPWDEWNKKLEPGLLQRYRTIVNAAGKDAAAKAGGQWNPKDPFVSRFATGYVGERITQLDETTRSQVADLIRRTYDEGQELSIGELAEKIGTAIREKFEGYAQHRALTIARTESAIVANHGTVMGFAQSGLEEVDVIDGTDDPPCAEANGQRWTLREALEDPIAHPNCRRVLSPVPLEVRDTEARARAFERWAASLDAEVVAKAAAGRAQRISEQADPHGRSLAEDAA
jgi:hypothetical protein